MTQVQIVDPRNRSMPILRAAIAVVVTLAAAFVHGRATERWQIAPEIANSARFVRELPAELGRWKYIKDASPIPASAITELGVIQYVSRVYSDGQDSVSLLLMSGRTGQLCRHSPEICYGSVGNTFLSEPIPVEVSTDGHHHHFLMIPIRPQSRIEGEFVVIYGFADHRDFASPQTPRFVYHGIPAIDKVQLLCQPNTEDATLPPTAGVEFLKELCSHYDSRR